MNDRRLRVATVIVCGLLLGCPGSSSSRQGATSEALPSSSISPTVIFKVHGCNTCHHYAGAGVTSVGLPVAGLFGSELQLADGRTVLVDEAFIRRSILEPLDDVTKGFPPVMPRFRGSLSEAELASLIDLYRSAR